MQGREVFLDADKHQSHHLFISYGKKREYKGRPSFKYPHTRTIEIYKEENAEVVCGYDAHRPEFLSMRNYEEDIRKLVGDMNFLTNYKRLLSKNF